MNPSHATDICQVLKLALALSFPWLPFDPPVASENQRFCDVFRGGQKGTLSTKGLKTKLTLPSLTL